MLPVLLDPSLDFDSVVLLFFKDLPCPLKFGIGLLNFFLETGHERFLLLKSSHGLRESLYPVFISRVDSLHFVGCRKLHAEALKLFDMGFICSTFSKLLFRLILLSEGLQKIFCSRIYIPLFIALFNGSRKLRVRSDLFLCQVICEVP